MIVAEMIAQESGVELKRVPDRFACDARYTTPKVKVRGIIFRDGKILPVQERSYGLAAIRWARSSSPGFSDPPLC